MAGLFSGIRRTVTHLKRYRHIMAVLVKYGFGEVADILARRLKIGAGAAELTDSTRPHPPPITLAQRLRLAMEELGPTFIKLGQLLSTRPDLLPAEYIEELEQLQDHVTPEKPELIQQEIQRQLGGPPEDFFAAFDPVPIAAASIAQVHRARTRDGCEVVLKIRRPHIVKTLLTELEILQEFALLAKRRRLLPDTFDPERIVREFSEAVATEVDLANERRNQQCFIRNFAGDPTVHVPQVFEQYSAEGLLTMEYIDGIKPAQAEQLTAAGLDPRLIARRLADFVLRQLFEFGLFHTDPHPGNLLVMPGNVLAPLDFGQVGRLARQDRHLLRCFVLGIVYGDASRIIDGLEQAQALDDQTHMADLTRDIEELLGAYAHLPVRDVPFSEILKRVFEIIRRHRITPPRDFTLMLKCLMTLESCARRLDRDFRIIEVLAPYARKFSREEFGPRRLLRQLRAAARRAGDLAATFPEDAAAIMARFRRGQFKIHIHHEHLEELEQTLDNSSNRISLSVIIAALLVGSSLLVPQQGSLLGLIRIQSLGVAGYLTATVIGVWLVISIIRSRHY
jgi:ubiquinone biosynthesis protein